MKIHFRIDSSNQQHSRFTVFLNGRHCGQLCLGTEELVHFFMVVRHGTSPTMDEYSESGRLWPDTERHRAALRTLETVREAVQ